MHSPLSRLWQRAARLTRAQRPAPSRRTAVRPRLEALEDRCVPTVLPVTSTLDNVAVPGTLRYAVAHAQNGDTIDILTAAPIALTKGELLLSHNVTILAPGKGALISGSGISRVFEVAPQAQVRLVNLTLIDGNGTAGVATAVLPRDGDGGAILNEGSLLVSGCTLAANTARTGGAIYNDHGTLFVTGSTLLRDTAKVAGGAIYNDHGTLALSHSTLSYDTAGVAGGGLFTDGGKAALTGDRLSHDSAGLQGGGVYHTAAGTLTIALSTFSADAPNSEFGPYVNGGGNVGI